MSSCIADRFQHFKKLAQCYYSKKSGLEKERNQLHPTASPLHQRRSSSPQKLTPGRNNINQRIINSNVLIRIEETEAEVAIAAEAVTTINNAPASTNGTLHTGITDIQCGLNSSSTLGLSFHLTKQACSVHDHNRDNKRNLVGISSSLQWTLRRRSIR